MAIRLPEKYTKYSGFGFTLLSGMLACSLLGYWIDQKRGGGQAWTIVGMILGLGYMAYETWRLIRDLNEENRIEDEERKKNSLPKDPL